MIRVVIAVGLSVALVGASLPAIDRARVAHSDAVLERQGDQLVDGIAALRDRTTPGGRWVVTVRVPARSWAHAGGRLTISDTVRWQADGGVTRTRRLSLPVRAGVTLTTPGRHRLAIRVVDGPAGPTLTVDRL